MDIGSLTGQIAIEDQMSGVLNLATEKVESFVTSFEGAFGAIGVGAAAAATAILGVTAAITALGSRGADINDLAGTIDQFSGSVSNSAAIMDEMAKGTLNTVDKFQLMQTSSKLLSSGTLKNAEDFGTLSQAAFVLQNRGLGSTTEMMGMLSSAMMTGRTRALQQAGVFVDLKKGQEDYARSLGTTADKLTQSEERYANQVTLLAAMKGMVKEAGDQHRDFGEQLEAAGAWVKNFTDDLASQVAASPAVTQAMDDIEKALTQVFGGNTKTMIDNIMVAIDAFARGVSIAVNYVMEFVKALQSDLGNSSSTVTTILHTMWGVVTDVWGVFKNVVEVVWLLITPLRMALGPALSLISLNFQMMGAVIHVVSDAMNWLLEKIQAVMNWMQQNTPIVKWLGMALGALGSAADTATSALDTHKTAVEGASTASADLAKNTDAAAEAQKNMKEGVKGVEDALALLHDKSGNTSDAMKTLNDAIIKASEKGGLTTPVIREVGLALQQAGIQAKDITLPALKSVALASDQLAKASGEAGDAVRDQKAKDKELEEQQKKNKKAAEEYATAVAKMTSAMVGTNKELRDMPNSVRWVIEAQLKAGNSAEDVAKAYKLQKETVIAIANQMKVLTDVQKLENSTTIASVDILSNLTTASKAQITENEKYLKTLSDNLTKYALLSPAHQKEIDFYRKETTATEDQIQKAIERMRVEEQLASIMNVNNTGLLSALTSIGEKVDVMDTLTLGQQRYVREVKNTTDAVDGWASALSAVGGALPSDSKIGKAIGGIGAAFGAASASQKSAERIATRYNDARGVRVAAGGLAGPAAGADWGYGSIAFGSGATPGERAGAVGQIASAGISGYYGARASLDQASQVDRTLGMAQTGAQVGSAFGPQGALIGMGVGAIIGAASKDPAWAVAADQISETMGITISEGLARTIGDDPAGIAAHLGDIIAEAGGLTQETYDKMLPRLSGLLNQVSVGVIGVDVAVETLNESWGEFARVGTSDVGVLDRALVQVIQSLQAIGGESEEVTAYLGAQGQAGASAFGDYVTVGAGAITEQKRLTTELQVAESDLMLAREDGSQSALKNAEDLEWKIEVLNEQLAVQQGIISATTIVSQESADALAAGVAAQFDAMINSGMSFHDAVEAIQPAIEGLKIQMDAAGIAGSEVFDVLQAQVGLYADDIAGPALSAVDSLTQGMVSLSNMGQLNQDTFTALSGEVYRSFTSLSDQGYDANAVLIGMKDSIQRMWEEQQEFGFHTDAATQALIDQAVAEGIVGEKHKSVTDQMLDASNRMVDILERIALQLSTGIPGAAESGGARVKTSIDGVGGAADNAANRTRGAADSMERDWNRVHDAATGAAEGHSPSGIKQVTVRTVEAQQAVQYAAGQMVAAFGKIFTVVTDLSSAIMDTFESVHQQIVDYQNVDAAIRSLTASQKSFIELALAAGVSIANIAELLGTSTIAIQSYVDANKKASTAVAATNAEVAKQAQVMADINQAIADHVGAADELATLTAGQLSFIDSALDAGVSVNTLAGALGTTVDAIQLYIDTQKAAAKASQDAADAAVAAAAATAKAAADAAAATAAEAKKITDINQAIADFKGAADEAATFSEDERTFIKDAIDAGISVAALADVLDTTTYAIQHFINAQKSITGSGGSSATPLTGAEAFERWRSGYSNSLAPTQYYATGGEVVPFQQRGTDTVPAMLTPGERVLSVDQNNQYEQTIEGPSNQEVVDSINALRSDMSSKMPRALARALHTGLVGLRTAS